MYYDNEKDRLLTTRWLLWWVRRTTLDTYNFDLVPVVGPTLVYLELIWTKIGVTGRVNRNLLLKCNYTSQSLMFSYRSLMFYNRYTTSSRLTWGRESLVHLWTWSITIVTMSGHNRISRVKFFASVYSLSIVKKVLKRVFCKCRRH